MKKRILSFLPRKRSELKHIGLLFGALMVSAFLYVFAGPGVVEVPILAWFAFTPLFWFWHRASFRAHVFGGMFWGALMIGGSSWWLINRDIRFLLGALCLGALLGGVLFIILKKAVSRTSVFWFVTEASLIFVGYEWLVREGMFLSGYFSISESQYRMVFFPVAVAFLGKFGLDFLIMFTGGIIFVFLYGEKKNRVWYTFGGGVIAFLFISSVISLFLKHQVAPLRETKILVVQGDPVHYYNPSNPEQARGTERLAELTMEGIQHAGEKPDLVVWPNTSVPHKLFRVLSLETRDIGIDSEGAKNLFSNLADISRLTQTPFLFGTLFRVGDAASLFHTNAMVLLKPDGTVEWSGKRWPVFGQEYIPSIFRGVTQKIFPGSGNEPQMYGFPKPFVLSSEETVTVPICSENGNLASFPGGGEAVRGSSYIIHTHHFIDYKSVGILKRNAALDQMLASVSGKPVLSVGSAGFTALFTPFGDSELLLPAFKEGTRVVRVPDYSSPRYFVWAQWGAWAFYGILAAGVSIRRFRVFRRVFRER